MDTVKKIWVAGACQRPDIYVRAVQLSCTCICYYAGITVERSVKLFVVVKLHSTCFQCSFQSIVVNSGSVN